MSFVLADDFGTCHQIADAFGCGKLTVMRADGVHLVGERLDAAVEGVERYTADGVGGTAQLVGFNKRPHGVCGHELSAVEECQTLFRFQGDGFPAEACIDIGSRLFLAFEIHFAKAEQRQGHMGKRGEVARRAKRTLLIYSRQNVVVIHIDQTLNGNQLTTRHAVLQRLDFEEHDEADNLLVDLVACAARVAHYQVLLKLGKFVGAYADVAERAKTGCYAIDRLFLGFHFVVEILAATIDASDRFVGKAKFITLFDDAFDVLHRDMVGGNKMCFH